MRVWIEGFLRGRYGYEGHRVLRALAVPVLIGAILLAVILSALSPGLIISSTLDNPLGLEALPNDSKAIEAFMYALIVVGASSMLGRLRHAGTIERQQIKWFAYATVVVISGVILKNSVYPAVGVTWVWWVGLVLTTVGVVSSPVVMGIAILRYRLYEIDILINRTLVYGSLTAVLAGVYLGGVVLLQYAFRTLSGEGSQLAVVASTLIIAALFIPLRRRIQGFIDRRFRASSTGFSKSRPSPKRFASASPRRLFSTSALSTPP